ncbi:hypothetical protein [Haloglycomyces albus]|uniref:hypothetical protein n=1 Tax=Haloglycomyces albus TaxID=526067 RepID=UPI00046CF712|nr:hypothetical protein [Haloglycomyces albus]
MARIDDVRAVKQRHADRLLSFAGVTGVDIGYRFREGTRRDEVCLRLWVERKGGYIPAGQHLPSDLDGVATDVVERAVRPNADERRYRPLIGGVSMGPCRQPHGSPLAGTLGAIVRSRSNGVWFGLTNWHVAAVDGDWSPRDDMVQPSQLDGGSCPDDVFGSLEAAVLNERVDAALVSCEAREAVPYVRGMGLTAGSTAAELGMEVSKVGRTTGVRSGIIDGIEANVSIDYGGDVGRHRLVDQLSVAADSEAFGLGGDSGSVVLGPDRRIVGLYFAGTPDGLSGIANPIGAVEEEFDIVIDDCG